MGAVVHQFKMDHLDCLIILTSGYSKRPPRFGIDAKEKKIPIDFVVNFELPETYNQYKDFGSQS
jgi:hypothetical protein